GGSSTGDAAMMPSTDSSYSETSGSGGGAGQDAGDDARSITDTGVTRGAGRGTLLPQSDSGEWAGPCGDRLGGPGPYVGLPCVQSADGGVSVSCYSNGVKVLADRISSTDFGVSVKKPDGTDCYTLQFTSPTEVYSDSQGVVVHITYDYDGMGNNRVMCTGMTYQFSPDS